MRRIFPDCLRPRRARTQPLKVLRAVLCLTLLMLIAVASPSSAQPRATSSSTLRKAVTAHAAADHTLASRRKALRACLRKHPKHGCRAARRAVRLARGELTRADRRIAMASRHHKGKKHTGGHQAPAPGGPVTQTEPTPKPKSPGGGGSSHGSASGSTEGTSVPPTGTSGSGSPTTGTSGSGGPTTGSGSGSGGTTTGSGGSTTGGAFEVGAVVGSAQLYELPWLEQLGAHTARMEFSINTPASQLEPVIEGYAKAGIRPLLLAGFQGRLPSPAEAQNLASWAAAFGPGGTFWKGKSYPAAAAVTDIEFGNETSYSYQFSDTASNSEWYALSSYATRAQTYALRFASAETAIQAANPNVGLLAQADDGDSGSPTWIENMFAAVPNLAQLVAGWTVHPYGPTWETEIGRVISSTAVQGASANIPIYATEWGLSSDDGRCVEENFGFNKCMTYSEAASTLDSSVTAMHAKYGSRLRGLYIFQARDQQATGASGEREGYCGALQVNQAPKGAYTTAVQSLLAAHP